MQSFAFSLFWQVNLCKLHAYNVPMLWVCPKHGSAFFVFSAVIPISQLQTRHVTVLRMNMKGTGMKRCRDWDCQQNWTRFFFSKYFHVELGRANCSSINCLVWSVFFLLPVFIYHVRDIVKFSFLFAQTNSEYNLDSSTLLKRINYEQKKGRY